MWRRFALFGLCVMIMLCFAGCSESNETTTVPTEPSGTPGLNDSPAKISSGFEFEVNEDGISCTITGLGDCEDLRIQFPGEIDGYIVTAIGDSAFYGHDELLGISLSNNITQIGDYAFFGCASMNQVELGEQVTDLGKYAFACCRKLEMIHIPASVQKIGDWAFFGCNQLKGVYISDMDRWCAISFSSVYANPLICAGELYLNDQLVTEVTIPNEVTYIGDWLFGGCTSLTKVVIHENVTGIGERAFMDCENITEIHFGGTIAQWRAVSKIANWNFSLTDYTVRCTDGVASE